MPIVSGGGGGGTPFNGGTITKALAIAPTATTDPAIEVTLPAGAAAAGMDYVKLRTEVGSLAVEIIPDAADAVGVSFGHSDYFAITDTASVTRFLVSPGVVRLRADATGSITLIDHLANTVVEVGNDGKLGFFAATPAAQPALTSGSATPAQIAVALQALGLASGS